MKSLHQYLDAKLLPLAIRFDRNPPSLKTMKVSTTRSQPVRYRLLNLPHYLCGFVREIPVDCSDRFRLQRCVVAARDFTDGRAKIQLEGAKKRDAPGGEAARGEGRWLGISGAAAAKQGEQAEAAEEGGARLRDQSEVVEDITGIALPHI